MIDHRGSRNPNYGKKHPGLNAGDKNGMWKGDNVSNGKLHSWVRNHLPKPEQCQECNIPKSFLDLANVSGIYTRDFNNWKYLCRKCHMLSDGRLEKFQKIAGKWIGPHPMLGRHHSDESKRKISDARFQIDCSARSKRGWVTRRAKQ